MPGRCSTWMCWSPAASLSASSPVPSGLLSSTTSRSAVWHRAAHPRRDRLQVLALVVGRDDHGHAAQRAPRGRSVSVNVPASAGAVGSGQARRSKRIFDPATGPTSAWICAYQPGPGTTRVGPVRGREEGPGIPSDRSSSRRQRARPPLSTGCPGPSRVQPPAQPGPEEQPPSVLRLAQDGPTDPSPDTDTVGRLTAPAGWPGAGLRSNIPLIAAMSTGLSPASMGMTAASAAGGLFPLVLRRYD